MKYMIRILLIVLWLGGTLPAVSVTFRTSDEDNHSRIVFEGDRSFTYTIVSTSRRLELHLPERAEFNQNVLKVSDSAVVEQVLHELRGNRSVFAVSFKCPADIRKHFVLDSPFRVVFDLVKSPDTVIPKDPGPEIGDKVEEKKEDPPVSALPQPKARPIETICIDPGHGGEDFGAMGKSKLLEKDITLTVAHKLKKLIQSKLGLRVIMTREKDAEVSLNTRASIANNQQAQMFVSIHVNSSFRKSAFGSETYFVSLNATDQEALELARKENQSKDDIGESIQNDELKMILWNMAQTEYIRESSRLAESVQYELNELLGTRNRGVKQAPFRVLMRAAMSAVLVEVAFISNSSEEKNLKDENFQDRVASAIFIGLSKFISYYNSNLK
jgi:N-acetylmuramoyl-L-alanine amidase